MSATASSRSVTHDWPAYVMVGIVFGAAMYAFSPRPTPAFPPTEIHTNGLLVNGLAQSGAQFVAAGEGGHILIADNANGPWHEASVEPARGSTLTQVKFISDSVAIAVGHDGWILRSEDGGRTWKEAAFSPPPDENAASASAEPPSDAEAAAPPAQSNPLFGIAGPYSGKLFAFGAFGEMQVSSDDGKTWQRQVQSALGDHHLYGMAQAGDGSLVLVGERGLMLKSSDNGENWHALPSVYDGSFFGILALPSKRLLAFGMRGNAFYSADDGQTWKKSEVPEVVSLFGGTVTSNGSVLLAGEGCTIMRSTDGAQFTIVSRGKRERLTALIPVGDEWLTAGEGGIAMQKPDGPATISPVAGEAQ